MTALAINVTGSDARYPSISLQLDPGFKTRRVQGVRCVQLGRRWARTGPKDSLYPLAPQPSR